MRGRLKTGRNRMVLPHMDMSKGGIYDSYGAMVTGLLACHVYNSYFS